MECRLWKREQEKEKGNGQKNDKEKTTTIIDVIWVLFIMRAL